MGMVINHSFDHHFVALLEKLQKKYGTEMFELEGIDSKNLDIAKFTNKFLESKTTADVSVDANANVDDTSILSWDYEMPKALMKLNGLYFLWKDALKKHGIKRANKMIELEIAGGIRIHDLHGWLKPYSYYGKTLFFIKEENVEHVKEIDFIQLFQKFESEKQVLPDREVIDLTDKNIKILDGNGQYTGLVQVLKHKRDTDMYKIEYKSKDKNDDIPVELPEFTFDLIVTANHPVILADDTEVQAAEIKVGDILKGNSFNYKTFEVTKIEKIYSDEYEYVYDITTESHTFYSSLLTCHNCWGTSMSTIVNEGMPWVKRIKIGPIKHFYSFINNAFQLICTLSTQCVGAVAVPDFLIYCEYFIRKDFGDKWYEDEKTVSFIRQAFQHFIYSVNNSFRGNQSLTYDEKIVVDGKSVAIGEFVESYLTNGLLEAAVTDNHLTYTLNRETGKMETNRIKGVIKHKAANKIVEYVLSNGAKVKATDNHSFFTRVGGDIIEVQRNSNPQNLIIPFGYYFDKLPTKTEYLNVAATKEFMQELGKFYATKKVVDTPVAPISRELVDYAYLLEFVDSFITNLNSESVYSKDEAEILQFILHSVGKLSSIIKSNDLYTIKVFESFDDMIDLPDIKDIKDMDIIEKQKYRKFLQALPLKIVEINECEHEEYVYDISVENNENFLTASNIYAHNSPFTNVSVYDKYWLESLFSNHMNPDFTNPNLDNAMRVQKLFVDELMNQLDNNPFTFPVMTAASLLDEETKEFKDTEWLDWLCDVSLKNKCLNFYQDDSTSSISSCMTGDSILKIKNIKTGIEETISIKDFVFRYNKSEFVDCEIPEEYVIRSLNPLKPDTLEPEEIPIISVLKKTNNNQLITIQVESGNKLTVTPEHKFLVKDIKTNTIIMVTALDIHKNKSRYLIPCANSGWTIVSKTTIETAQSSVYCIGLKTNNIFEVNGIYTHNCCRLKNELTTVGKDGKQEYVNSFGVGGISIGSHRVVCINLPQISYLAKYSDKNDWGTFFNILESRIKISQDILDIHKELLERLIKNGNLPMYNYGVMDLNKQYSTLGFIGLYECLEIMGLDIRTEEGLAMGKKILGMFNKLNTERSAKDGRIRNLEQIPGESAAVTFCLKDKLQFVNTNDYDLYANQYLPLIKEALLSDRIRLQGEFDKGTSGGAILHADFDQEISKEQIRNILNSFAKNGVIYGAIDDCLVQCKNCGKVVVGKPTTTESECCKSEVELWFRTVGFKTPKRSYNKVRRTKDFPRRYCYHDGPES